MNHTSYLLNRGIALTEVMKITGNDTEVHYPLDVIADGQYYQGWSIRQIADKKFKLVLPDAKYKLYFFGLLDAIKNNAKFIFVTEGIEDALILRHANPNSIAILGLAMTRLKLLLMLFDTVYWVIDQDEKGRSFAQKVLNQLNIDLKNKLKIVVIPYKDVNDYWRQNPDGFREQFGKF
jgi:hypothetical protein